jgi:DNA ligase (NAD+)
MVNDFVIIEKSGEIIPKVISVVKQRRPADAKPITFPDKCPSCGAEVTKDEGEVALRCLNVSCGAQLKQNIIHFASRDAMDIRGLGASVAGLLVDNGLIKDYGDIYSLKRGALLALERFAEKSADNLLKAIEESKGRELNRLIFAMGIRHVGTHAAFVLANKYGNLEALSGAGIEDLEATEDIGPVVAESIHGFFNNKRNKEVIEKLKERGVATGNVMRVSSQSPIKGLTIVVTGSLSGYTRSEIEELVARLGGHVSSSVSKKTDLVLAGESPGSKIDKAKSLGVKVVNEAEFKKMIGGQS